MTKISGMKERGTFHDLGKHIARMFICIAGDGVESFELSECVEPDGEIRPMPVSPAFDGECQLCSQTEEEAELIQDIFAALLAGVYQAR